MGPKLLYGEKLTLVKKKKKKGVEAGIEGGFDRSL